MGEPVKKPQGEADPVLAALIAKLPPSGANWSIEKRTAWLELMWKTFGLVYEGGEATDLPAFLAPRGAAAAAPAPVAIAPPKPGTALGPVEYIIDINGNLKRLPDGVPIKFNDIPRAEMLWDERPDRNRNDAIICADGEWPIEALPQLNIGYR